MVHIDGAECEKKARLAFAVVFEKGFLLEGKLELDLGGLGWSGREKLFGWGAKKEEPEESERPAGGSFVLEA